MNIVVFGGGTIGQRIIQEALNRGHMVSVFVRNPSQLQLTHSNLTATAGNVLDPASVAQAAAGHDAVISAIGPGRNQPPQMLVDAAHSLIEGLTRAGVRRLIVVGGAGSLEVAPGVQLLDTPTFNPAWRPGALAARDALAVYRTADLDWTVLSPADLITPGERTGHYRTGTEQLVRDENGKSYISAEDYAVALIDELEKPHFVRRRFTVAY
jgi:putative NADH-flavin reductase